MAKVRLSEALDFIMYHAEVTSTKRGVFAEIDFKEIVDGNDQTLKGSLKGKLSTGRYGRDGRKFERPREALQCLRSLITDRLYQLQSSNPDLSLDEYSWRDGDWKTPKEKAGRISLAQH